MFFMSSLLKQGDHFSTELGEILKSSANASHYAIYRDSQWQLGS